MMGILKRAVTITIDEGIPSLVRKGSDFVSRELPTRDAIKFFAEDQVASGPNDGKMMITLRDSTLDSDMTSLIIFASEHVDLDKVFLAVNSEELFRERHNQIMPQIKKLNIDLQIVELDTKQFRQSLIASKLVVLRNTRDILGHRLLSFSSDRKFIHLFHGLAKATGNLSPGELKKYKKKRTSASEYHKPAITNIKRVVDKYSVCSDFELFYWSAAEGIHPSLFKKCGYPKFDRLNELVDDPSMSIMSNQAKQSLCANNKCKIIYAPTHRGNYGSIELFPFPEFDLDRLISELKRMNTELYIRTHISEEKAGVYDKYVDGNNIKYAGHSFSPSAAEMLPHFDILITDYSSIYLEYLPVNKPLIFIENKDHPYWKSTGVGYDYDKYFPGPKIGSFDEFLQEIEQCLNNSNRYREEREFVSKVLLSNSDISFLNCILSEFDNQELPSEEGC